MVEIVATVKAKCLYYIERGAIFLFFLQDLALLLARVEEPLFDHSLFQQDGVRYHERRLMELLET
jgi:hypothetical protein